jgi:hypothetical protein
MLAVDVEVIHKSGNSLEQTMRRACGASGDGDRADPSRGLMAWSLERGLPCIRRDHLHKIGMSLVNLSSTDGVTE